MTIDDDVAKLLADEVRRTGDTFKGTVNRVLLRGLTTAPQPKTRERFVITPRHMGLRPGLSYDCVAELLEEAEGPYHR